MGEAQSGTGGKLVLLLSWTQCTTIRTTLICFLPWSPICRVLGSSSHTAPVDSLGAWGCRHCSKMFHSSVAAFPISWWPGLRCGRGRDSLGWGSRADRWTPGGGGQTDCPLPSAPGGAGCRQTALLHTGTAEQRESFR